MSIVRTGLRGRRSGLRGRRAYFNGILDRHLGRLGQDYTQEEAAADWNTPDTPLTLNPTTGLPLSPYGSSSIYGTSAVPGSISPQEAQILSQAIASAGQVGTQAIIGTPTVSYNAATGQYTATGGATIPGGLVTGTQLTEDFTAYLPYILIGGVLILVVSMAKR
jgi:hypothetical protein